MTELTVEKSKELLEYDPISGRFVWKVRRSRSAPVGSVAGSPLKTGYFAIVIGGKKYRAHRLAWFMTYGSWPENELDHINGVRTDNSLANLRPATRSENFQNKATSVRNSSGYQGVSWDVGTQKWRAKICLNRKQHHLGVFDSLEDAAKAYAAAKAELHNFQPTVR